MTERDEDVVAVRFEDESNAYEALSDVGDLHAPEIFDLRVAVVVRKARKELRERREAQRREAVHENTEMLNETFDVPKPTRNGSTGAPAGA